MGLFINTNSYANNAQRNLLGSSQKLGRAQRLSSGLRVNSAADDAAGLAISERFNSQIRGQTVRERQRRHLPGAGGRGCTAGISSSTKCVNSPFRPHRM